jgi:syntaxin-binding protein 1
MDRTNGLRGGAASLNDMKDMLADLPQYQEQREQV